MPPCVFFLFCLLVLKKMNVAQGRQQYGMSWKDLNHISSSGQLILLKSQVSSELARFG